jgi:hypothetical protein
MERKLASIQKIIDLQPISGADKIEVAYILGWQCVVKKGDFKTNELCVFIEVDSQLPQHVLFDFMKDRKFKVRTIRLLKQISQGLVLPLSILKEFTNKDINNYKEGDDITELIGITKYDPRPENANPVSIKKLNPVINYLMSYSWFRKVYNKVMPRKTKGNFPNFIKKTDEIRLQSYPTGLKKNLNNTFYLTEKLDGSSASYFFNKALTGKRFGLFPVDKGNGFGVCSRNLRLVHQDNRYWWKYALQHNLECKLQEISNYLNCSIAIQGELVGPGIQKNKYLLQELDFYCFNVFNIDTQQYFPLSIKKDICKKFDIKLVPIDDVQITITNNHTVQYFIELSKRKSSLNQKVMAEGIVARIINDESVSFKVINPEWLLKNSE